MAGAEHRVERVAGDLALARTLEALTGEGWEIFAVLPGSTIDRDPPQFVVIARKVA